MRLDHKVSTADQGSVLKAKTAIFVMPATSKAWEGAEGLWVTVAGWAEAAKRNLGNSVVVTQDRIASAKEVLDYPLISNKTRQKSSKRFSSIPSIFKIVYKDFLEWKKSRHWKILDKLNYQEGEVAFVWEKHDLFSGSGLKLAKKYKVPYISYVHAPVVWEAEKWGVRRFLWGSFLEKREAALLRKADIVAAVSKEVKAKLINMGVARENILVSPMAVDPDLYNATHHETICLKEELGLKGKYVIGWTGSFRGFHGLEQIIAGFCKVYAKHPVAALVLIGDGKERPEIQKLVNKLGLEDIVLFTGKKPYREIPKYLSLLDLAVAGAKNASGFHYSPQKIRDYMAAGIPVLAPNAGEVSYIFEDEVHLKLFEVGDVESIANGMIYLLEHPEEGKNMAIKGQRLVYSNGTWDYEVRKCLAFINDLQ